MMRLSTLLATLVASMSAITQVLGASWITSNTVWYDTDGKAIDAHGGGIVQRGDTFYWVGQSAQNGML
jgi:hypothetical protein